MKIIKAKYTEENHNWVSIEFEDGTKGQSSLTDGIRRQHTDLLDEYIADGGVVEAQYTDEEIQAEIVFSFTAHVQTTVDETAKANGSWDNMMSARASAKPILETDSDVAKAMKVNANALESYYFEVWGKAYEIEQDITDGVIAIPTLDEFKTMLPMFGE